MDLEEAHLLLKANLLFHLVKKHQKFAFFLVIEAIVLDFLLVVATEKNRQIPET